ncbi:hypothetical protein [Parablautia muri]|uniref:Uncharacterized protein n=1 Tax=Parablautia muri TaxID=2320879 RepID=A0A9X5BI87_9FIRM|nr:hypothetical protein [Parablautia muri]NBJ94606.1 hypothetical protein [Parablautia muri]
MKDLIRFEYKKMCNGISIVSLVALSILTVLFAIVTLNLQYRTIDSDGNVVNGLASFRALKEVSEDLEGVLDGKYIRGLIEKYDSSYDKAYLAENRGFLGTGGMTKYIVSNYVINYAYYGLYMSNGNEKVGLDYDFLDSEESFYQKYREAVLEQLLYVNAENGLFPHSEEQIPVLEQKIQNIKTPFQIAYHMGWANVFGYFGMEYPVFFIILAFCLSGCYAKDSTNGMDELILSSICGRKRDMQARWIAGNLFTVVFYMIYVLVLIAVHGGNASLHGLGASAQTFWFECLHNFSVGTALLIVFFGGLAGALVMANLVMLLSIKLKNAKLTTVFGIIAVVLMFRQASTYSQIKMLNPLQFKESALLTDFLFVGNAIVPYFVIALLLSAAYITVCWLVLRLSYKKYRLN